MFFAQSIYKLFFKIQSNFAQPCSIAVLNEIIEWTLPIVITLLKCSNKKYARLSQQLFLTLIQFEYTFLTFLLYINPFSCSLNHCNINTTLQQRYSLWDFNQKLPNKHSLLNTWNDPKLVQYMRLICSWMRSQSELYPCISFKAKSLTWIINCFESFLLSCKFVLIHLPQISRDLTIVTRPQWL